MVIALTSGRTIALHKTQVMKTLAGMLFMLVFFFCGSQAQGQDKDKETYYIDVFIKSTGNMDNPPLDINFGSARINLGVSDQPLPDHERVMSDPDAGGYSCSSELGTVLTQSLRVINFYYAVIRWHADQIRSRNEQTTTSVAEGRNSILAMLSVIKRLFMLNRENCVTDSSQGVSERISFDVLANATRNIRQKTFGPQLRVLGMFFYGFLLSNGTSFRPTDLWMSLSTMVQNAVDIAEARSQHMMIQDNFKTLFHGALLEGGALHQNNTIRRSDLEPALNNYIQENRRLDFSHYFWGLYDSDRLAQSLLDVGGNIAAAYGLAYLLNSLLTGQFPEDSSEDLSIEAILRSAPALPLAQQTLMASLRGMPLTDIAELNRPAPPADGSLAGSRSSGDDNKTRETIRNILERNLVIDPGSSNGRIPPLVLIGLSALEDDLRIQELNRNVIGRLLGIDMNQNTSDSTPTPASETGPIITENDRQTIRSQLEGYITASYSNEIASEQIPFVSFAITDLLLNLNDLDPNAMDQTEQVTELLKRYFKHFSSVLTDLVNNNNSDLRQVRNLKLLLEILIKRATKVHSPSSPADHLRKPPGPGGGAGGGAGACGLGACGGYTTSPY